MPEVAKNQPLATSKAVLTPVTEQKSAALPVDDTARLKEIRALVAKNNQSSIDDDTIICQIYMESRFDAKAESDESTARGLMQLLKNAVRELYRIEDLSKPRAERSAETKLYLKADKFHDSPGFLDEGTNIRAGTRYLELLIQRQKKNGAADPIAEAYKKYRGRTDGRYYAKIKASADKLRAAPNSMQVLRDMVK